MWTQASFWAATVQLVLVLCSSDMKEERTPQRLLCPVWQTLLLVIAFDDDSNERILSKEAPKRL